MCSYFHHLELLGKLKVLKFQHMTLEACSGEKPLKIDSKQAKKTHLPPSSGLTTSVSNETIVTDLSHL